MTQGYPHALEPPPRCLARAGGGRSCRSPAGARRALGHVPGLERIAAMVGFAGAGESTMLAGAREAWEVQGYRVRGAALAGKAAEGLDEASSIRGRTLASWAYA